MQKRRNEVGTIITVVLYAASLPAMAVTVEGQSAFHTQVDRSLGSPPTATADYSAAIPLLDQDVQRQAVLLPGYFQSTNDYAFSYDGGFSFVSDISHRLDLYPTPMPNERSTAAAISSGSLVFTVDQTTQSQIGGGISIIGGATFPVDPRTRLSLTDNTSGIDLYSITVSSPLLQDFSFDLPTGSFSLQAGHTYTWSYMLSETAEYPYYSTTSATFYLVIPEVSSWTIILLGFALLTIRHD